MYRRSRNIALLICGVGLLLATRAFSMTLLDAPVQAWAQRLPPRPTLTPHAKPVHRSNDHAPDPTGRITGTVIDLTNGAPAPGITVSVGGSIVTTDTNGNYDRARLPPGNY